MGVSSRDFFQSTSREAGVIIWVQFLQCPPPKICDGKKIDQNFARFLTTFDFDREHLRKGSTYQQWEKLLIIYDQFHVRRRKLGILWSTNEKVTARILMHTNCSYTVSGHICQVVLFGLIHQLPLLRVEFRIPKVTFHSDLRRRAASRRALPCPSSLLYNSGY